VEKKVSRKGRGEWRLEALKGFRLSTRPAAPEQLDGLAFGKPLQNIVILWSNVAAEARRGEGELRQAKKEN
jgi:hypothetical protein